MGFNNINTPLDFRNEDGSTVVDVTVVTTTRLDPFDASDLEAKLQASLKEIAEDGKLGDLQVDFSGSTDIRDFIQGIN